MYPILKPGYAPVVRDLRTLQLGRSVTRTLVLPNDDGVRAFLAALDGQRTWEQILTDLAASGDVQHERGEHLKKLVLHGGFVDDAQSATRSLAALPDVERHRLHDDMTAWARSDRAPSAAITTLQRRRARWVQVDGCGRLAVGIAHLLALAGIGHVSVRDRSMSRVCTSDLAPLGPYESALGSTVLEAVRSSVANTSGAAARAGSPAHPGTQPDLIVIVGPPHSPRAHAFVQRGTPHLFVHADTGSGVVGPLVVVGQTSCGRCVEHYRSDEDPARAWVVADAHDEVEALDTVTVTATAALATGQVLQHLEQRVRASACDALLTVDAPSAMVTRHLIAPHPACGCTWASAPTTTMRTMAM